MPFEPRFGAGLSGRDQGALEALATSLAAALGTLENLDVAVVRSDRPRPGLSERLALVERDAVLVAGGDPGLPGLVLLDADGSAPAPDPAAEPPVALVGVRSALTPYPSPVPSFTPSELGSLAAFLRGAWQDQAAARPLLGLVLTGGRSERMGLDKASLRYSGPMETRRMLNLLSPVCGQVFVSCRAEQADLPGRAGFPQLHDTVLNHGPVSGLLSALEARPDAAWLVAACDLPLVNEEALQALVSGRHPLRFATAFRGHQGLPEPLFAIWEPKSRSRLFQFLAAGIDCPRKVLLGSAITLLEPPADGLLTNVNSPAEREAVLHDLGR